MPLYSYECSSCKKIFDVRHGMFFEDQRCIHCHSDQVYRLPSNITLSSVKQDAHSKKKPGQIVDEFIKETKKEIKKEKDNMKVEKL
tara:strand:+ start:1218 stop:1475 length:258 start_codon:yes stop_codon:yes gene_type:complete